MLSSIHVVGDYVFQQGLAPAERVTAVSFTSRQDLPQALKAGLQRPHSVEQSILPSYQHARTQSTLNSEQPRSYVSSVPERPQRHALRTIQAPAPLPASHTPLSQPPAAAPAATGGSTSTGSIITTDSSSSAHMRIGLALAASAESESESEEEDPFHFDRRVQTAAHVVTHPVLQVTSPPSMHTSKEAVAVSPRRTSQLARSLMQRASFSPIHSGPSTSTSSSSGNSSTNSSSASTAGSRFSIVRTQTDEGDVFVHEVEDKEGRRWSLSMPADGLPEDMLRALEELEKLAQELATMLPRIVVTQSIDSFGNPAGADTDTKPEPRSEDSVVDFKATDTLVPPVRDIHFPVAAPALPRQNTSPIFFLSSSLSDTSVDALVEEPEGLQAEKPCEDTTALDYLLPRNDAQASFTATENASYICNDTASTDQMTPPNDVDDLSRLPPGLQDSPNAFTAASPQQEVSNIAPAIVQAALPSDPAMNCIYLPELAPERVAGIHTSPAADTVHSFSFPAPTARQRAATFSHTSPRSAAFFAALDGASSPRSPEAPDAKRPVHHTLFPNTERAPSGLPGGPLRPIQLPSDAAARPLEQRRSRGKSLLQLRSKSSKPTLRTPSSPAPAPTVPQMPAYKWSSSTAVRDLAAAQQAALLKDKDKAGGGGFKALFRSSSKAARSVSEPPPYLAGAAPTRRLGAGAKARQGSGGVPLPPMPPVPAAFAGGEEAEGSGEGRRVARMHSARDLFKLKMK